MAKQAEIRLVTGRLRSAAESYDELLRYAARHGGRGHHATAGAHAELSALLAEWDDLDGALRHAEEALILAQRIGNPAILVKGELARVRAQLAKGDLDEASEAVERAVNQAREGEIGLYRSAAEALRARLWLVAGDLGSASSWAAETVAQAESSRDVGLPPPHPFEYPLATLARVRLAEGRGEEARRLVASAIPLARDAGRLGRLVELSVLEALSLEATARTDAALELLERALALAEPEGYVRTFLDEGRPLALLLTKLLPRLERGRGEPRVEPYARRLLGALAKRGPEPGEQARPHRAARSDASALIEPLTERELEVLCLLAEGLSNGEIARRLYLSSNTVRAHTYNLYGKLGVHGRVEAANQGRRLGLLPTT